MDAGTFFAGYKIVKPLGHRSSGELYLAMEVAASSYVTLLVLDERDPLFKAREANFNGERAAAGGFVHPSVCRLLDSGRQGSRHYLVIEHVRGMTLESLLDKHLPISYEDCVSFASSVVEAITAAHASGVVHGGIVPSIVYYQPGGKCKLTGFGCVTPPFNPPLGFIAPERRTGGPPTTEGDLYSIGGIVACLALRGYIPPSDTGEADFGAAERSLSARVLASSTFSTVATDLRLILASLFADDPLERDRVVPSLMEILRTGTCFRPVEPRYSVVGNLDSAISPSVASGFDEPPASTRPESEQDAPADTGSLHTGTGVSVSSGSSGEDSGADDEAPSSGTATANGQTADTSAAPEVPQACDTSPSPVESLASAIERVTGQTACDGGSADMAETIQAPSSAASVEDAPIPPPGQAPSTEGEASGFGASSGDEAVASTNGPATDAVPADAGQDSLRILEEADSCYWRAQNALFEKRFSDAMKEFKAIMAMPAAIVSPLASRVEDEICLIFWRTGLAPDEDSTEQSAPGSRPERPLPTEEYIDFLEAFLPLANALERQALITVTERRLLETILAGIDDRRRREHLFREALMRCRDNTWTRRQYCRFLQMEGRNTEAARQRLRLASTLADEGLLDEALDEIEAARRACPEVRVPQRLLSVSEQARKLKMIADGVVDLLDKSGSDAFHVAEHFLDRLPSSVRIIERLAELKDRRGEIDDALRLRARATAICYNRLDNDRALRNAEYVIRHNPGDRTALTYCLDLLQRKGLRPKGRKLEELVESVLSVLGARQD